MKVRNADGALVDLREFARGQRCQVWLPGCLDPDRSTVILAHLRRANVAGVGQKPPDLIGVHACHACHRVIDGVRDVGLTRYEIDTNLFFALIRTLKVVSDAEVRMEGIGFYTGETK